MSIMRTTVALAFSTLMACSGTPSSDVPDVSDVDGPEVGPDIPSEVGAVEDPSGLVRRIRAVGPQGEVPEALIIHLGEKLFRYDQVGNSAPDGTTFEFEPALEGELTVGSRDTLRFEPAEGFLPGTHYAVKISSLGLPEETIPTPDGADWSASFDTVPLMFLRVATQSRDLSTGHTELDLVFTAPVDSSEVASRVSFRHADRVLKPHWIRPGDEGNEVRVRFQDKRLREAGALTVGLGKGVPLASNGEITAPAAQHTLSLKGGEPIEILEVAVKEGVNGHYLDVVCRDDAVEEERYWWDPETYDGWWVSQRCQLSEEEVATAVRVSPAVELTAAAGPAGFRLFGDFEQGDYELTIDGGAETVDGGVLEEAWVGTLRVPERTPRLSFVTKGRYLPRSAWQELSLQHLNVEEAELEIRHVPPENLVFWMTGSERTSERTANLVLDTEVALGGVTDVEHTSHVDVGRLLPSVERGVYEVRVQSGGARDATRILLTDMHLVVKRAERDPAAPFADAVWVWALDVHDNRLLSGVDVDLVSPSGRTLSSCETDFGGSCVLRPSVDAVDQAEPVAVIATKGDDLTYLAFGDLELSTEEDISGLPYRGEASVKAAMYSDRGVYRPGDTAHVAALVRDPSFVAPEAGLPVVLKLYDPRDKELRRTVLATDAAGMLAHDLTFADFATTGSYRVALEVGGNEVGQLGFAVEEFVPERMKVDAVSDNFGTLPDQPVAVEVEARWLFGGVADDARVELRCDLAHTPFRPAQQRNYHYGLARMGEKLPRPVSLGTIEGRLDGDGLGKLDCPAALTGGGFLGAGQMRAHVAVFEGESGRTTKALATSPVHPESFYLGTKLNSDKVSRGDRVDVEGVVVDWEGALSSDEAPAEVSLEIFRLDEEVGWIWDDFEDTSRYRRILRRVSVGSEMLPVAQARFSHSFTAPASAAGWLFVVRAGDARTEHYVEGTGRRYWWEPGEDVVDQTPRPQKPTSLALVVPTEIEVGEEVSVSSTVPYGGRLLWTVETDGVLHSAWQTVDAGPVAWDFTLSEFDPNVYVSALLVKDPHLESGVSFLPDRAHGVASVRVAPVDYRMDVALKVPEEVQPYGPLEVKLDVGAGEAGRVATVAVVDEGILQLTDFDSPDPLATIFARRALGVDSFETVGWTMLSAPSGASRSHGGDADGGDGGRVQMVKPVALWSGVVEVPANGKLTVPFDIPGYRGQVRVMAVVASGDRMGSADADVLVRDPLVLQTTLPRFLVGGDEADIPVFVSNMSGADRTVKVSLEVEEFGPMAGAPGEAVRITSPVSATLSLPDGESGTAVFEVQVGRVPSSARFRVLAQADDLTSREELEVPLMPAEPESRQTQRIALTSGANDLSGKLTGWAPGSDRTTFWVTTNPYAESLSHLRYLVRYPYGCIEQTTSSTRPLLYVSSLVQDLDPELVSMGEVDEMVAHGIERVLSMQTAQGGFGYWPGASSPSLWGTAYGSHMLVDAREAGHTVPEAALNEALDYLDREVGGRAGGDDHRTLAYAHYVLALSGKGHPEQAAELLERLPAEEVDNRRWRRFRTYEARYLLMAAMYLGGDRRHEDALKSLESGTFELERSNDWSFYSELRARGLVLSVFHDLFGSIPEGRALADRVADATAKRASRYYTTQELAWAITGLGKRVAGSSDTVPDATLTIDGATLKKSVGSWSHMGAAQAEAVGIDVSGQVDELFLVMSTQGVRATRDLPEGGDGLALTRSYRMGDDRPLSKTAHRLGDTITVELTLVNRSGKRVQNIALVDRIPAGWEIENPRMGGASLPDWVDYDDLWGVEHMNVRDDRLEVFGTLNPGDSRTVVYQVRAVTAGTFTVPEASAEAMYDPELWARQYGDTITIEGPWSGSVL